MHWSSDSLSTVRLLYTELTTEGMEEESLDNKSLPWRRSGGTLARSLGTVVLVSWYHGRENDFFAIVHTMFVLLSSSGSKSRRKHSVTHFAEQILNY